jgi:hypothetical protein
MWIRNIKVFLGLFLLVFAAVQFNDPDPMLWIMFYAVGAFICISSAFIFTKRTSLAMLVYIFICIGFAIFNWPNEWLGFDQKFSVPNINVERARESCGLLISALFTGVCWVLRFK